MIRIEWGTVPLRLMPTRIEVRFYGITLGRFAIGILRSAERKSWARKADQ